MPIQELERGRTALGHRAMLALRPGIGDAESFAAHVDGVLRPEGYRMAASFDEGEEEASAVAGMRISAHHFSIETGGQGSP